MPKLYYTTDKNGEEVEVDSALASQLVQSGKKKPEDFTIEDLAYTEAPASSTRAVPQTPVTKSRPVNAMFPQSPMSFGNLPAPVKFAVGSAQKLKETFANPLKVALTREAPGYEPPQVTMPEAARSGFGSLARYPGMGPNAAAMSKQILNEETTPYQQLTKGDPVAKAGELITDVGLFSLPGSKIAKAGQSAKFMQNLSKPFKSAITGVAEGAASAGQHQVQNIGRGQSVSPLEAMLETGASGILPFTGQHVSQFAKNAATKIVQTAVKSTKKVKGKNQMTSAQAERFLDDYGSWKGLKASGDKITKHHESLSKQFDNLINNLTAGKQVNLKKAIQSARDDVAKKVNSADINLSDVAGINKTIDEFEQMTAGFMDDAGNIDFKMAQNFKRKTLDPISKWDKPSPLGTFDPSLQGPSQAARSTRKKLAAEMELQEPSLAPLNKKFKDMAEIEPFIENSLERLARNRGLSLQDLATLSAGALGAGGAAYADNPEYAALAMLPFLISRGQKSPGMASSLWKLGKRLENPNFGKDLLMQGGRSAVFGGP